MSDVRDDKFVGQLSRSADLYKQGLITAKEFTDVTIESLHRLREQRWNASQRHVIGQLSQEEQHGI